MIELTARDYDDLCRTGRVRAEIATVEEKRKAAVRRFWLLLLGSLVLGAAIVVSLGASEWLWAGVILAVVAVIAALVLGFMPLNAAKEDLKHPVLEDLARRGGMEYIASGFEPPVFPSAGRALFGRWSSHSFTDLFHGVDAEGRRYAVYEGTLTRRQGKSTVTVFTGQVYAFQRRSGGGGGETAILPDKGLFNFIKPRGMDRVRYDSDPEFDRRFEIYSTHAASALGLAGSAVRRVLLDLRQQGRVYAWMGPEDALVAVWGKERFEPGSMFRSRAGEERVRLMFDDVCASLAVLRRLRDALG